MGVKLGNGKWAIKEDKLLAYNDNSGRFFNKEFDFSRGSSATYVAKDGLIKTAGLQATNLVNNGDFSELGSELVTNGNFDTDSDWTLGTGWSISDGKVIRTAQSGSTSAYQNVSFSGGKIYKIQYDLDISAGSFKIRISGGTLVDTPVRSTSGTYTEYIVANSGNNVLNLRATDGAFVGSIDNVSIKQVDPNDYWTLGTGWGFGDGVATCGGNGNLDQIMDITNGNRYKVSFTILNSTQGTLGAYLSGGFGGNFGNGTHAIEITGGSASSYDLRFVPISSFTGSITNISVQEIQTDTPRIDFSDTVKGALLLENQSTNLITYSEDFSQWAINALTTLDTGYAAPDGSTNAYKVTSTGTGGYVVQSGGVSSNDARTIYAKTVSGSGTLQLLSHNTNTNNIFTITEQWQRFELNSTTQISTNFYAVDFRGAASTLTEVIIWGAQSEALSYATSYIPTFGSTATRLADVCNNSGSAQDFNSEEGVLYAEIAALQSTSLGSKYISISDETYNNRASILFSNGSTNQIRCFLRVGGVSQVDKSINVTDVTGFNKVAFCYKENEFKVFVNGSQAGSTDTSGSVWTSSTITKLSLTEINSALGAFNGKVRNVQVFTEALTDEQLQKLTTI